MSDLFGPRETEDERRARELLENEAIFGKPVARPTDPHTSHRAARDMRPRAHTNRGMALLALEVAGAKGLTDFELADATGRPQTSIGVRRGELARGGWVADSGRTRPAPSGADSIVWVITANGRTLAHVLRKDES